MPARPSPVGALLTRTAKGDWPAALKVAAGPTLMLLVLAGVLALFGSDKADASGLGWGVRMRIALALLLQSVGGGVSLSGNASASLESFGVGIAGEATLSLVPLVVTVAWAGVLAFAARRTAVRATALTQAGVQGAVGARTAVPETVLRIAALCGVGTFALGLLAQPSYDGIELSSTPFLALLWSFLLAAAVCGVVLGRGEAGAWLTARPGWQIAVGALRTALIALLTVVTLAGVVTVVTVLATAKEAFSGGAVVAMLALLPNIGAMALAMAWGAPVNAEWNLPNIPFLDSGRQSIGYGELGHLGGGWGLFGVIVGGLVCALLVGFLAVRRSADRREQLLSAGFFVVSLVFLVLVAGASVSATFQGGSGGGYGYGDGYGDGYGSGYGDGYGGRLAGAHGEVAAGGAETLLFALLWTFGAVLVVPYLLRMVGRGGGPAGPAAPGFPYAAAAPAPTPTPTAADLPPVQLGQHPAPAPQVGAAPPEAPSEAPPAPRRRAVKWLALALAAFLVGGGATAGALYFTSHRGGSDTKADSKADKPAAVKSGQPTHGPTPSVPPSPTVTPSGEPTGTPTGEPTAGLPDGFVQKHDPYGFSLAVQHDWKRSAKGTQTDYKAPVGKSYLRIGVIANAPQSSYDNFLSMEKGAEKRTNYQRMELRKNTFQNSAGARWEFTYVNDTGNTVHAIDQAYVAADGTEYSIYYECLEALYDPENDKVFSTALSSWSVSDVDVD
ncbi:hypothetical protein ACH4SK_10260 [Streptomyces inhibens]|uniref:hypothetical protein n=1 Tax=Streptomyces inhibens TaxID=2293571 RepID=UPI0037ABA268